MTVERKKRTVKKFECINCHYCKTRTFKTITELTEWCGRKSIKPNKSWVDNIIDFRWLRLIWCEIQTDQFCSHGLSPRNASPKHTANITSDVIPADRKQVVITNLNKDPFIMDVNGVCPHFLL